MTLTLRKQLVLPIITAAFTVACPLSAQSNNAETILWQDLSVGMTPDEVAVALREKGGIKRVRVLKPKKSNPSRRLKVSYKRERIVIVAMPFEVEPRFEMDKLNQLVLLTKNQCGANAVKTFSELGSALGTKYPTSLFGEDILTEAEIRRAQRTSSQSGEPEHRSFGYSDDHIAVLLTFRIKMEAPPAYPSGYSKLGHALWRLARTQYEGRKSECEGNGDKRMDVVIQYLPIATYEAARESLDREEQQKEEALVEQL